MYVVGILIWPFFGNINAEWATRKVKNEEQNIML